MTYLPTWESVQSHTVPEWFRDAKLGIFIHWGLYSVPAWAPTTGELGKVVAEEGWEAWFARNPYAEWYMNSLRIDGSATQAHHLATYGEGPGYDDFVKAFHAGVEQWDPGAWARLFRRVGARYVVLTTKHHDGFLLWPSRQPNPFKQGYQARRDLVGDLTSAVRAEKMRMGLYYSGGLDWTFNDTVIRSITDLVKAVPQQADYVSYADNHWLELVERYEPIVLWNDIAYPAASDLPKLLAHYYNTVPEGLVNNRFTQSFSLEGGSSTEIMGGKHYDFTTPEYASYDKITEPKWEATRGIGFSFGYNRNEGPESYLSVTELVRSFVDIVSKNGNLLLNVGPMADGTIPSLQRERLEGLGAWLDVHGEAIFDTRPWAVAEGSALSEVQSEVPVRFTQKADTLYATLLAEPVTGQVLLKGVQAVGTTHVSLLGHKSPLAWQQVEEGLSITVPGSLPTALDRAPASTLTITPQPKLLTSH
jgi:alpha-L-fucosidase